MTDLVPVKPNLGGRPKGSGDKVMKDLVQREQRKLARIEFEEQANTARRAAEDLQRITALRAEQKDRVHQQYVTQEQKRAPQFQIDTVVTLVILGVMGLIMFLATAILTADGTIGAAESAKYAVPWFGYVLFGSIEVAILVFLLVYYVRGSRIDYEGNPVEARQWFVAAIAGSVVAVGLSAYHVLDEYNFDWSNGAMYVGIAIRLTTTIFFVLISKAVATVLFARAVRI